MYSAEEAAQILGLQVRTVRNYVRDGRLPGVRIGKQYRISRADLESFTAGGVPHVDAIGPEAPTGARMSAEVSSIVQIDGIGATACERLERTLAAVVLAGQADDTTLRIEPLYDSERERLKVILVGSVAATAELLRVIERFAAERE